MKDWQPLLMGGGALFLVFLLLVGGFVQYPQQLRADDAIGLLFSLTPSTCHLASADGGATTDVPVEAIKGGAATMYPEYRQKLKAMTK